MFQRKVTNNNITLAKVFNRAKKFRKEKDKWIISCSFMPQNEFSDEECKLQAEKNRIILIRPIRLQ